VKGPCSPQSVGIGDEELVEATVGALNKAIELDEVLEPGAERGELLLKVVNVRIDEGVFDEAWVDEAGATDSVQVSSAGDTEPAVARGGEVINVDVFIGVEVTGDTHEDGLALVPELREEGDEVDNPEGAVTGELASEVTLLNVELAEAVRREAFKVEVVVVVV
jgi:hypothetical protein